MSEELDLARARAKAKANAMRMREQESAPEEQEEIQEPSIEEDSKIESFAKGAVEGVPFAKDALAAGETLLETGTEDFGENFSKNQTEWNESLDKAEQDNPITFFAGDVASSVATGIALPGSNTIRGAVAFGAAAGVSRGERDGFLGVAQDAVIGGTIARAGAFAASKAGKAINYLGKKMGVLGDETIVNITGNRKKWNEMVSKMYMKGGKGRNEANKEIADLLLSKKVGPKKVPLVKFGDTTEDVANKFAAWGDDIEGEMSKVLEKNNRKLGKDEIYRVYSDIKDGMGLSSAQIGKNPSPVAQQELAVIKKKLKDNFFKAPKKEVIKKLVPDSNGNLVPEETFVDGAREMVDMDLTQLQRLKVYFGKKGKFNTVGIGEAEKNMSQMYSQGNGVIGAHLDDLSGGSLKNLNKQWATAKTGENLTRELNNKQGIGWNEMAKDAVSLRTLALLATVSAGSGPSIGLPVAVGLQASLKHPKTAPAAARAIRTIADHLKVNPSSELAKRIAIGAGLSVKDFRTAVSSSAGEINLMKSPIERTVESVKKNADAILQTLEYHNKDLANSLREALRNKEDESIAAIMAEVVKNPATKDFIQGGQGFNGKIYDPEEKATIMDQLKGNKEMGLTQRLAHMENLRVNNVAPQPEPEQDRFRKHISRDKSAPEF